MTGRTPKLAAVIRRFVNDGIGQIQTMMPGRVESFDADNSTCSVKPLIKNGFTDQDGEETLESLPVIPCVPVAYPNGTAGGARLTMTWPLAKGDMVTIQFTSRSIDQFMAGDGEDTNPVDPRTFDLSDAVVIPFMFGPHSNRPSQKVDPDGFTLGLDDGTQIFIGDGCIGLNSKNAGDRAALDSKVQDELSRIKSELDDVANLLSAITGVYSVSVSEPGNGAPSVFQAALLSATSALPSPSPQSPGDTHSDIVKLD